MVISFNGKDKMVTMADRKIDEYEGTAEVEMEHLESKLELTVEYLGQEYFQFSFLRIHEFRNYGEMFLLRKRFEYKTCMTLRMWRK